MGPTTATARRSVRWVVILAGALLAAAMIFFSSPTGAFAAEAPDTPGGDQEATDFYFGGRIEFDGKPVNDVVIAVKGNGFDAETVVRL